MTLRSAVGVWLQSALVTLCAVASASASGVSGTVKDQTGLPLPGVIVEARAESRLLAQAESAVDGTFVLTGLPEHGVVELRWALVQFAPVTRVITLPRTAPLSTTMALTLHADVLVTGDRSFRNLADLGEGARDLVGAAASASEGIVPSRLLANRPLARGGDILEAVPGLLVSQHSGEGKANQYYLRGFNLDHGTDLALSVAGVPVNLPTHAHGQGYADLNFLIPELVSGIRFSKGAYSADAGDFASAGAADISYVNSLEHPMVRVDGGQYGSRRALAAASPRLGGGTLLVAAERTQNNGPWVQGDNYDRVNGLVRFTRGEPRHAAALTFSASAADWRSTDQVPLRAIETGRIPRFGFVDPSDGGRTNRASLVAELQRGSSRTTTRATAFALRSGLNLFSNFTYFLDDPVHGDQFEQEDRRWVFGGEVTRRDLRHWGRRPVETTLGTQVRHDAIGAVGLFHTEARTRLDTERLDRVAETSAATFAQAEVTWSPRVRTMLGLRGDAYRFDVSGVERWSGIASPKATLAVTVSRGTELYANGGTGFHSNDARVITGAADESGRPGSGGIAGATMAGVQPLTRSRSLELGLRTVRIPHVQSTLALWRLGMDSELVFAGDAGTSEAARASRRAGVEWSTYVTATPWLAFDGDVSASRARFTVDDGTGTHVPGAAERVTAVGATLTARRLSGSVRARHMGSRPLIEDGSVRSKASTLVSADLGLRLAPRIRIVADGFNLLNRAVSDIDYFYASRLPGEAADGIAGIHTHPAAPRTFRVSVQVGR